MRWDDRIFTGAYGKWSWLVAREMIPDLSTLTTSFHVGQRLCITAFDSGLIIPSPEERRLGWTLIGDCMVSPQLSADTYIPCDEHDEWYVFPTAPTSIDATERYVNYLGFNLADAQALADSQDPTWDRTNYDWLIPLQQQFWSDIERLDPSTYVSSSEADIVVTCQLDFFQHVLAAARQPMG